MYLRSNKKLSRLVCSTCSYPRCFVADKNFKLNYQNSVIDRLRMQHFS